MKERTSIPHPELPAIDRQLLETATRKGGLFEPDGLVANWASATLTQVIKGYGKFAYYLRAIDALTDDVVPSRRINQTILEGYVDWLGAQDLSSVTIASLVSNLHEAIRVMEPGADLSLLRELVATLRAREVPRRNKHARLVHPQMALDAALSNLDMIDEIQLANDKIRACRYRDLLIIAFLTTRPIRLKNLTQLEIGRSIEKRDTTYACRFTAEDTKERKPLSFALPELLTPYLDRYIEQFRPLLLDGRASDRLWVTIRRGPMAAQTIYCHVCDLTEELLGCRINPHLFRDIVATAVAVEHPDKVLVSARLLNNTSLKTTDKHYIQSQMIDAQRVLLEVIEQHQRNPQ